MAADVSVGTTGPDSDQGVNISNTNEVHTTNTNRVTVVNKQLQEASSGDVSANKNTSVGGLGSGNARNEAVTETSVSIGNQLAAKPIGSSSSEVTGGAVASSAAPAEPGRGGSVLGASSEPTGFGAGATLPEVGASQPIDVSAIRAAWHPASDTSAASKFADRANAISAAMFATAALLSLVGAIVSAVYARRQKRRG